MPLYRWFPHVVIAFYFFPQNPPTPSEEAPSGLFTAMAQYHQAVDELLPAKLQTGNCSSGRIGKEIKAHRIVYSPNHPPGILRYWAYDQAGTPQKSTPAANGPLSNKLPFLLLMPGSKARTSGYCHISMALKRHFLNLIQQFSGTGNEDKQDKYLPVVKASKTQYNWGCSSVPSEQVGLGIESGSECLAGCNPRQLGEYPEPGQQRPGPCSLRSSFATTGTLNSTSLIKTIRPETARRDTVSRWNASRFLQYPQRCPGHHAGPNP